MKWSVIPLGEKPRTPKYFIVNADEMEPGTMKDRLLLEGDPHQLIEGTIISAYAIEASTAYIFLRWAYKLAEKRLQQAIADAYRQHFLGKNILGSSFSLELAVHTSAGRYMCGEETGLLNALEGKRAIPRTKPPFPQVSGLFGKPTVVNNVETVSCVPHIVKNGAEWFRKLSHTDNGGTKIYGASGRVKHPGLWELPLGTRRAGKSSRTTPAECARVIPSAGYCRAERRLTSCSTTSWMSKWISTRCEKVGSRVGTGTMIVLDDSVCPVGVLISLIRFFAHESCGVVYAMPGRSAVGEKHAGSDRGGTGATGRSGGARTSCAHGEDAPHLLRAGPRRDGAVGRRVEILPRRL